MLKCFDLFFKHTHISGCQCDVSERGTVSTVARLSGFCTQNVQIQRLPFLIDINTSILLIYANWTVMSESDTYVFIEMDNNCFFDYYL